MKLRFNPVIFVLLLIFAVCVFLLLFLFLKEPITVEGKWYCEKLGLQISLTEDSFVISNAGNEMACNAYSLKGSQHIVVYCLEENCDQWKFGDVVFSGEVIKNTETNCIFANDIRIYYTHLNMFLSWTGNGSVVPSVPSNHPPMTHAGRSGYWSNRLHIKIKNFHLPILE